MKYAIVLLILLSLSFYIGYESGKANANDKWDAAMMRHMSIHHPNGY